MLDIIDQGRLSLSYVQRVVIDEALSSSATDTLESTNRHSTVGPRENKLVGELHSSFDLILSTPLEAKGKLHISTLK
eukprot:6068129-Amphidinium_carterae.2